MALNGKDFACNGGDVRDLGLIPGLGKSPGGGTATHFSIVAWRIPWREESGGLQSMGSQRVDTTKKAQHTAADQSLSGYFDISPPGGDVSLIPKQIFTGEEAKLQYVASFFCPEHIKKEWFSKTVEEGRKFFSEHLRQFILETDKPFVQRFLFFASSGNSGWNFVFWGCIWWELGDVGTGWLLGRLFLFFESRSVVSDSLWPYGLYSPWNSPGQNTLVGSLSILRGIFPTQG